MATPEELSALAEKLSKLESIQAMKSALRDLDAEQLKLLHQQSSANAELKTAIEAAEQSLKARADTLQRELDVLNQIHENEKSLVDRIDKNVAARRRELEVVRALIKAQSDPEAKKALIERLANLEATVDLLEKAKSAADELATSLGTAFSSEYSKDFLGTVTKIGQALATADGRTRFLAKGAEAIGASMINNIAGLVVAVADAENAFMKATGASQDFADSMTSTYESVRQTGATMKDVSEAYQGLYSNFTDFTMIGEDQREMLGETAAVLNKLGVSQEAYAKGIQNSTKMMGLSVAQAEANSRELVAFAKDIGVAPSQIADGFAKMGPQLAKFGDQGVKAFKDLSRIAKITGMEMEKVLNITNKFDTFEGAAEQAGKLNAALGGNFVNAMDLMMTTDPADRFEMIRDSILDAGLSFDEMSYYQKNFYKETLGLSDVGDLAMMLSGNMDALAGSTNKNSAELIEMKENAAAVQSLQEQWNAVLADATPILTDMAQALKSITAYLRENPALIKLVIGGMITWKIATMAMTVAQFMFAASNQLVSKSSRTAGKGLFILAGVVGLLATAMMFASPSKLVLGLFAMGAALFVLSRVSETSAASIQALAIPMLQLGAAIFMVTGGVALMAGAFSLLSTEQMIGLGIAFGILTVAIIAMGIFGLAAAPGIAAVGAALIPLGFAMLMMGAAVGIAAAGMSLLVGSLITLKTGFPAAEFALMALSLGAFVLTLGYIGAMAPMAALGLLVLTGGIVALGLAMRVMSEPLQHLSVFTESLSALSHNLDGLRAVKTEIVAIADAISGLDEDVTLNLAKTVTVAAQTVATAGSPTLAKALRPAPAAAASPATSERPYEVTINLELNGEKLGDKVVTLMGGVARDALMGLL